ncbi:FAD-binding protein [Streptomyces sp. NBC_01336]|nr:FAD-binding protein [Streptomyces sp. NBC_01336]
MLVVGFGCAGAAAAYESAAAGADVLVLQRSGAPAGPPRCPAAGW